MIDINNPRNNDKSSKIGSDTFYHLFSVFNLCSVSLYDLIFNNDCVQQPACKFLEI